MSITDGPTEQRLAKAEGAVSIGDDKQGTRRYTFRDSALDRAYIPLIRAAKTDHEVNRALNVNAIIAIERGRHDWNDRQRR